MIQLLIFVTIVYACPPAIKADVNTGCPSWGCGSWGSFSLSSAVPPANGTVKWSTEIVNIRDKIQVENLRGCVSDQVAVICLTPSGYVSLDPTSGKVVWNTTSMNYPYLPVVDVYGDLIGIDEGQLVYVTRDGSSAAPVNISVLKPAFSVMIANNSMLLLTSANTDTAQIVTYNTDGVVCGAVSLYGTVNNVNGTFIPVGHPIIVGFRAYIITQFQPNATSSQKRITYSSLFRLYAFDLLDYMAKRIRTVWYIDIPRNQRPRLAVSRNKNRNARMVIDTDVLAPIVAYSQGTVYVNIPLGSSGKNSGQPLLGTLWGLVDNGDTASFAFKNIVQFGQMVVYNVNNNNIDHASRHVGSDQKSRLNTDQTLWISSKYSSLICGYSSRIGILTGWINITYLADIDQITSQLAITRQSDVSLNDVLIFGGLDTNGSAHLVAIETYSATNATLLWKTKLSDNTPSQNNSTWEVSGQIVNFAEAVFGGSGSTAAWQFGLIAMVLENGTDYTKLHIKGVY